MTTLPTTIVLLDPTAPDGESALDLLDTFDDHVALVVLLSGPSAASLAEFAAVERIDVGTAGWTYLDQVADRLATRGLHLETIAATGPDPVSEIADIAATRVTRRVLLPAAFGTTEKAAKTAISARVWAPVSVASTPAMAN